MASEDGTRPARPFDLEPIDPTDPAYTGNPHRLKGSAVGLVGVLFLAVTSAAPISAMLFNTPIAVGYGNGIGAPAGFWIAMVALAIFTVGYVAMARKITTAGGFYGFISHGLGRPAGMASGALALVGYSVIEASLLGAFAVFSQGLVEDKVGAHVPWPALALGGAVLISILTFFRIDVTAKILGVALIAEVLVLLVMNFAVLFQGGADGISFKPLSPVEAFRGIAPGVGLFFAFWSWVGFEATANYGEESRDPKRIVPRATYVAVIGLGIFYTFSTWMVVNGWGLDKAVKAASDDPANFFFPIAQQYVGGGLKTMMQIIICTGSFACAMAFRNTVCRYFYAMGRDGVAPRWLGWTHRKYQSPWVAILVQAGIVLVIVSLFAALDRDPFLELYGWLAIVATLAVLVIQSLCCLAVVRYFRTEWREEHHLVKTLIAPLVAFAAQGAVIYLLIHNLKFIAGGGSAFVTMMPWDILIIFAVGLAYALYLRKRSPEKYERLGRITFTGA